MVVEKIWFENHPLRYLLWPILWPLSKVFGWLSQRRRAKFDSGEKTSYRAPVPVVVVGNITAGGNGKTPVVVWLVEQLQALGYTPGVVSRGYGAKAERYPLLVTETVTPQECGDEPKLIHSRTQAPVAVDPVRSEAVKLLLEQEVDVVVTDDGLQHYALQRDIEISVVDGKRRFGSEDLIPLGPLREPVERLEDVDFIITNGGSAQTDEIAMTLTPADAINLITGEKRAVSELNQLVAFAGIGHPPRFFNTLESLGADVVRTQGFADHQDFDQNEIIKLSSIGENVIMTEKDAVKCQSFAQENWWYLPVSAEFSSQDKTRILNRIKEVMEDYGSSST